jgi:hypothetical protein
MFEYNGAEFFTQNDRDMAEIADLQSKVAELTHDKDYWHQKHLALSVKVDNAQEAFKEILAGDMDAKDIMETYGAVMAEHLGWEFENEVSIEISVSWRGTVSIPFGTSVEDLDIDDFGLNEPCHAEYSSWFNGFSDYTIEER